MNDAGPNVNEKCRRIFCTDWTGGGSRPALCVFMRIFDGNCGRRNGDAVHETACCRRGNDLAQTGIDCIRTSQ